MCWPAYALGPFVFFACLPVECRPPSHHGWQGLLLQGECLNPAHRAVIQNAGSGLRQQRQGPSFHNAFWVTPAR